MSRLEKETLENTPQWRGQGGHGRSVSAPRQPPVGAAAALTAPGALRSCQLWQVPDASPTAQDLLTRPLAGVPWSWTAGSHFPHGACLEHRGHGVWLEATASVECLPATPISGGRTPAVVSADGTGLLLAPSCRSGRSCLFPAGPPGSESDRLFPQCQNLHDSEHLTWLVVNHIQDLVALSHEPPVQDFISAVHRNSAASGLFIQAIQSRCEDLSPVSVPLPAAVRQLARREVEP